MLELVEGVQQIVKKTPLDKEEVLHCVAACCSVLQEGAVCCNRIGQVDALACKWRCEFALTTIYTHAHTQTHKHAHTHTHTHALTHAHTRTHTHTHTCSEGCSQLTATMSVCWTVSLQCSIDDIMLN